VTKPDFLCANQSSVLLEKKNESGVVWELNGERRCILVKKPGIVCTDLKGDFSYINISPMSKVNSDLF